MSIVVNRVQREILLLLCTKPLYETLFSNACRDELWSTPVAGTWKLHRTTIWLSSLLPDTESRSVAGHKTHSLVPLTPPFMDQKVVL